MKPEHDAGTTPARDSEDIATLIRLWKSGDVAARDRLTARMLPELRRLSERELHRLGQAVSLQASDLVQESVIELLRRGADSNDAMHLRALAAGIVRTTLIDYLRVRNAPKRGRRDTGSLSITLLANLGGSAPQPIDLMAIHDAMRALATRSPRAARIVELRIFGGMSETEVAEVLGISRPTVSRDWVTAKLVLARALSDEHAAPIGMAPSQ